MIISSSLARVATSPGHPWASRRQPPRPPVLIHLFGPLCRFLTWMKLVSKVVFRQASGVWCESRGRRSLMLPPQRGLRRMPNWNNNEECEKWNWAQATPGNQSCVRNKKSKRLLIEWTCLSEIKRGSTTVFSYQQLMVASQDSCTNLN